MRIRVGYFHRGPRQQIVERRPRKQVEGTGPRK